MGNSNRIRSPIGDTEILNALRLSALGAVGAVPTPLTIGSFQFDDIDLGSKVEAASVEPNGQLKFTTVADAKFNALMLSDELRNGLGIGTAQGWQIRAELLSGVGVPQRPDLYSPRWRLLRTGENARFWYGVADLDARMHAGNLSFIACDGVKHDSPGARGWLFRGRYDYYLLSRYGRVPICIDTRSDSLDTAVLFRELRAMQFVFGRPFGLPSLRGFATDGRCVEMVGGPLAWARPGHEARRELTPVGDFTLARGFDRDLWMVNLFERIASATGVDVVDAMSYYLGSSGDIIEGEALKLHVALEALADRLTTQPGVDPPPAYRSASPDGWVRWCEEHRQEIESLAQPGSEEGLFNAVRRAHELPRTKVVKYALESHGDPRVRLPKRIIKTMEARHDLVHRGELPKGALDDVDVLIEYVDIPRTLLIALIAKAVGYRGPILGYQFRDNSFDSPDWWTADAVPPESARQWYVGATCNDPRHRLP